MKPQCERCRIVIPDGTAHATEGACIDALVADGEDLRATLVHIGLDANDWLNGERNAGTILRTILGRVGRMVAVEERTLAGHILDVKATLERLELRAENRGLREAQRWLYDARLRLSTAITALPKEHA